MALSVGRCHVDLRACCVQGLGQATHHSLHLKPQKARALYYFWIPEAKNAGGCELSQPLHGEGGQVSAADSKDVQRGSCLLPGPRQGHTGSELASGTVAVMATHRQQILGKNRIHKTPKPPNPTS